MAKTVERNTLEYFLQYPQEVLQGLKNSQSPEIITREGEPVCVMMDMEVCRKIQQRIDFLEACEGIRKGLDDAKAGRMQSLEEFDREFRAKYHISPK
ncbi:MAG: hypothetical protein ACOX5R_05830 [bacterium]|jgi:PHD/YefM family antitoxin component YafN of YafNO toxin-antitoxin module